jgi:acyl-CoA thioester hydrolase
MFVVTETQVRYHRPARLDEQLLVTAWPQEIGRASLTIGQQAHLGAQPGRHTALLCEATIRIGWVLDTHFKPARIPADILKALQT